MSTLKGTWRLNDTQISYESLLEQLIPFTTTAYYGNNDVTFTCSGMYFDSNGIHYTVIGTSPELGYAYPIDVDVFLCNSGWTTDFDEGIKTITFTSEQDVSDEFYARFTANATEVKPKTLKGTWRFNEVLTVMDTYGQQSVNFTVNVVYEGMSATAVCTGIELANIDDGLDRLYFVSITEGFEGDIGVWSTGGWYTDTFGEGIKTITFTTEQEVSEDFYNWFVANATEVKTTIKAGTYRFNDVLTELNQYIEQPINFTVNAVVLDEHNVVTGTKIVALPTANVSYLVMIEIEGVTLPGEFTVCSGNVWYYDDYGEDIQTITFPTDSEVSPEFYAWFTANAVEVVEHTVSGVWKFKEELTKPTTPITEYVNYSVTTLMKPSDVVMQGNCNRLTVLTEDEDVLIYRIESSIPDYSAVVPYPMPTIVYCFTVDDSNPTLGWNYTDYDEGIKTIDFGTEPQTVSAEFYEWLTANATQPTAKITYNGSVIASLFNGQTATLKCEGMKMESDVIVEVAEQTGGECSGTHVIEVDELPTENIDETALYKVGDTYHRYGGELLDVLMAEYDGSMVNSLVDGIKTTGTTVELLYVKTKPTENIKETNDSIYNVYYVEDEDNIFVHTNGMWLTVSTALDGMLAYFKTVRSIDDIGETGEYGGVLCALIYTGWKDYPWANGTLTIEEIGIHNVTDKKEVNVNLGVVVGVWKFKQGGVCANDDLSDWEKFQPVNFTTTINGEVVDCIGIERYDDQKAGGCTMRYKLSDGIYYDAWCALGIPEWKDEGCKTVDFGTEPQIVSGEFKTEFSAVAAPIPSGGGNGATIVPLTVTENGTYDVGYKPVTEEWDNNTQYDFSIPVQEGVTLLLKKSEKFSYPQDFSNMEDNFHLVERNAAGEVINERDYCYFYPIYADNAETKIAGYIDYYSGYNVLWVKDGSFFNESYGVTFIEDNAVYLSNYASLMAGEFRSISLTAPGQPVDGFLPVTVDVRPHLESLTVTENGTYTPSYADGYRSVTVEYANEEFKALANRSIVETPVVVSRPGAYAFYQCTSLKRVQISGPVARYAFCNCTSLQEIITPVGDCNKFGENVINAADDIIGINAFNGCSSLSGHLRIYATNIQEEAFGACTGIESVSLFFRDSHTPDTLGKSAFRSCTNLKRVFFGDTFNGTIYFSAFNYCSDLESIMLINTNPPTLNVSSASYSDNLHSIYVPETAVETYKSADGWSNLADKIKAYPKYNITFHGETGLAYCDSSGSTWVDITDGMTVEVDGFIRLGCRGSNNNYKKIGTTPGGVEVARIQGSNGISTSNCLVLAPMEDSVWYISASSSKWAKDEIQPLVT